MYGVALALDWSHYLAEAADMQQRGGVRVGM